MYTIECKCAGECNYKIIIYRLINRSRHHPLWLITFSAQWATLHPLRLLSDTRHLARRSELQRKERPQLHTKSIIINLVGNIVPDSNRKRVSRVWTFLANYIIMQSHAADLWFDIKQTNTCRHSISPLAHDHPPQHSLGNSIKQNRRRLQHTIRVGLKRRWKLLAAFSTPPPPINSTSPCLNPWASTADR